MGKQQISLLKFGGWKKRKKPPENINTDVLWMVFMWLMMITMILISSVSGTGWEEEGDDSVNVISVENMDALLRLRMVTEYNSLEAFLNMTGNERRSKRYAYPSFRQKLPPPVASQVAPLCDNPKKECLCEKVNGGFINASCHFHSSEVCNFYR